MYFPEEGRSVPNAIRAPSYTWAVPRGVKLGGSFEAVLPSRPEAADAPVLDDIKGFKESIGRLSSARQARARSFTWRSMLLPKRTSNAPSPTARQSGSAPAKDAYDALPRTEPPARRTTRRQRLSAAVDR